MMTTPRKTLNPAQAVKRLRKVKIQLKDLATFKTNLLNVIDHSNLDEHESYHVHLVRDFLNDTFYKDKYFINTKDNKDLVIHSDKDKTSPVSVIIETKRPSNLGGMPTTGNLNAKAFQELLLYYLDERIHHKNEHITQLVITNSLEWFIFDAHEFDKFFYKNTQLKKDHKDYDQQRMSGKGTDYFYKHIAAPVIEQIKDDIEFTWFDIRTFEKELRNNDLDMNKKLAPLYKVFSPEHLLKLQVANDSNSLDRRFYEELLHIIGLKEVKQGSKKLIDRFPKNERQDGSLIENTILHLEEIGKVSKDQNFNIALELCITWINRILFLKLLESQLISYHKGNESYRILNIKTIHNYDDLNKLFFQVLAKKREERNPRISEIFDKIPYLNSSLFEASEIEKDMILISNLEDDIPLPFYKKSVLKEKKGSSLNTIDYLFRFLDAYDFSSEGKEEIQEEHKTLINASVLGLIFEKINGYKDGSYFTPGFITEYMCRETIRRAVVQKFNEAKGWDCKDLTDLHNKDFDIAEANEIVNSLKICDPAVGSGHFLVSALNEILAIKHELRILCDAEGKRLKHYQVEVVNDELVVMDREDGTLFEYHPNDDESLRIQKALFHEKQTIIENCLFGVDINPNSVKICRLRLWIELLKNAYYKGDNELETLPNIDINIKCGNSLISKYDIKADLREALKKSKYDIDSYRDAVRLYQNAPNKEYKQKMRDLINEIKNEFKVEMEFHDPLNTKYRKLKAKYNDLIIEQIDAFGMSDRDKKARQKKIDDAKKQLDKVELQVKEAEDNKIYSNAFEWRFEFPEVLDNDGNFVGFDVVIGNPPYIRQEELSKTKPYYMLNYNTFSGTVDIYVLFYELALNILSNKGVLIFITPNKWIKAGYGKPLRIFFNSIKINKLIDFGDLPVFDEAITYSSIISLTNEPPSDTFITANIKNLDFSCSLEEQILNSSSIILNSLLNENIWVLSNNKTQMLVRKLENLGTTLEKYIFAKTYRGILTGLNKAFVIDKNLRDFLLSQDSNNKDIIKPYLAGRNLEKYKQPNSNEYLLFTRRGINIKKYPSIERYLSSFRQQLEPKPKNFTGSYWPGRKSGHYKWYEIQDSIDYYAEFEKPKIIYQVFQVKPCFIFDDQGYYCNNSIWIIPLNDKRLLGILNSKLGWWLISQYCTSIQNGYQLIWKYFKQIPIPDNNELIDNKIVTLVNQIIEAKNKNLPEKSYQLESEIDQLVYELYGLTEEEIRIVEGDA